LSDLSARMKTLPTFAMKQMLATIVEIVVDMGSKEVGIFLATPSSCVFPQQSGGEAMRLVGTSASSSAYQTHQAQTFILTTITCRLQKLANSICYDCRRRAA
jgi:hypothetical protein